MFDWVKLRVSFEAAPRLLKLKPLPVPKALLHSLVCVKYRLVHRTLLAVARWNWTVARSCESVGAIKPVALKVCA